MATIYTIKKSEMYEVLCYDNQDEALDVAMNCPIPDMFLAWEGAETGSPCWIRFEKGGVEHYVAAFVVTFEGDMQAVLVALYHEGAVVHSHCMSLGEPMPDNRHAMVQLVEGEFGPTCLGPVS